MYWKKREKEYPYDLILFYHKDMQLSEFTNSPTPLSCLLCNLFYSQKLLVKTLQSFRKLNGTMWKNFQGGSVWMLTNFVYKLKS